MLAEVLTIQLIEVGFGGFDLRTCNSVHSVRPQKMGDSSPEPPQVCLYPPWNLSPSILVVVHFLAIAYLVDIGGVHHDIDVATRDALVQLASTLVDILAREADELD